MKKLVHNIPQRVFTFGCSFTGYQWGTWANILGVEFPEAEFRNFGRSGAGNQYIHNLIMQADNVYTFDHNDLVIVQWTNVCREDRFLPEKDGWMVPGNIFSQGDYTQDFIENYFSEYGSYVRDFALIKSAHQLLKHRTQHHMIKMLDFEFSNQWDLVSNKNNANLETLSGLYNESLDAILPSFYHTLWNNNLEAKTAKDKKIVHKGFQDGHPSPLEHYDYLKHTFKHDWKESTDRAVGDTQAKWIKLMKSAVLSSEGGFSLYKMKPRWLDMLKYETVMRTNTQINPLIHQ